MIDGIIESLGDEGRVLLLADGVTHRVLAAGVEHNHYGKPVGVGGPAVAACLIVKLSIPSVERPVLHGRPWGASSHLHGLGVHELVNTAPERHDGGGDLHAHGCHGLPGYLGPLRNHPPGNHIVHLGNLLVIQVIGIGDKTHYDGTSVLIVLDLGRVTVAILAADEHLITVLQVLVELLLQTTRVLRQRVLIGVGNARQCLGGLLPELAPLHPPAAGLGSHTIVLRQQLAESVKDGGVIGVLLLPGNRQVPVIHLVAFKEPGSQAVYLYPLHKTLGCMSRLKIRISLVDLYLVFLWK
ncbi:MAG: hypothetical protein Q4C26_03065 [Bacteroidales bacterium]|nr:hypothetical protein [Bacteroidales bacterium]